MPTTISEFLAWAQNPPAWVQAAVGVLFGWFVGRRGSNAKAAKDEADASKTIVETAEKASEMSLRVAEDVRKAAREAVEDVRKMAAVAIAKGERLEIENADLRMQVHSILIPLASFVRDWDRDCRRCETRPPIPPSLAEKLDRLNGGGDPH